MLGQRLLCCLLAICSVLAADSGLSRSSSSTINTWGALKSAAEADPQEGTLTLSPSFTMDGFVDEDSVIEITADHADLTIEGSGAIFDAASKGFFFQMKSSFTPRLTLRNITMKNGYCPHNVFGGGAIEVENGVLWLEGCTFLNNTAWTTDGGALCLRSGAYALIKDCSFVGPISFGHNDIYRLDDTANVTFACADDEVGTPVQMQGTEITVIPPKELQCTAGNCFCRDSKCVVDPTATLPCTKCETPGACV
jgi:pectate lyase